MSPRWLALWAVGRNEYPHASARGARLSDGGDGSGYARFAGAGTHRDYNVMIFASAVARFDRVVPDIVLAHAIGVGGEGDESSADASATVQTQILNAMEGYDLRIEVSSEQGAEGIGWWPALLSGTFRTYTCTMHYASRGRLLSASLAFRWGRRQRCRTSAR